MSLRSNLKELNRPIPIYVTRRADDGVDTVQGAFTVKRWYWLPAKALTFANIIGWGLYGLVVLVGEVV